MLRGVITVRGETDPPDISAAASGMREGLPKERQFTLCIGQLRVGKAGKRGLHSNGLQSTVYGLQPFP